MKEKPVRGRLHSDCLLTSHLKAAQPFKIPVEKIIEADMDGLKTREVILPALKEAFERVKADYHSEQEYLERFSDRIGMGLFRGVYNEREVRDAFHELDREELVADFLEIYCSQKELMNDILEYIQDLGGGMEPNQLLYQSVTMALCHFHADDVEY